MHSLPSISSFDRYEDTYFLNAYTGFVIHANGKVYKTSDGGRSFSLQFNQPNLFIRSIGFFDENTGIIGTFRDTMPLIRTTNSGVNWSKPASINGSLPNAICGINIVDSTTAFAVGKYACPAYFMKTTDKGLTWVSQVIDSSKMKSAVDCYFWSRDSGIVVGGHTPTINNWGISNSVVLFTADGGQSFTRVFKSTRAGEWGWKISFPNKNTGFVSIEAGNYSVVLKTKNKGQNWTENYFTNTKDLEGIGFINENTGWVGGWGGFTYQTTNGGANWAQTPWSRLVNRFRFISDTLGYCVGNSFYKFTQETVGIAQISEVIPDWFYLHQNYPNPFNPTTRINYEIRLEGLISLTVYDVKGNEIEKLVNEKQSAGIYSAEFNAASLPSGVYYYKLNTGNITLTRKMVLVK